MIHYRSDLYCHEHTLDVPLIINCPSCKKKKMDISFKIEYEHSHSSLREKLKGDKENFLHFSSFVRDKIVLLTSKRKDFSDIKPLTILFNSPRYGEITFYWNKTVVDRFNVENNSKYVLSSEVSILRWFIKDVLFEEDSMQLFNFNFLEYLLKNINPDDRMCNRCMAERNVRLRKLEHKKEMLRLSAIEKRNKAKPKLEWGCSECGKNFEEDEAKYCSNCGSKVKLKKYCYNCKKIVNTEFCSTCGEKILL